MKIRSVHITLPVDSYPVAVRSAYQQVSNYLSIALSEWISPLKLDLGFFNCIIFEEGAEEDLSVVPDRAFIVALKQDSEGMDRLRTEQLVHEYFSRKYLEGFARFDGHFGTTLSKDARDFLAREFSATCTYSRQLGEVAKHVATELYDPGRHSNLHATTKDAWAWFNQKKLPEGDLFTRGPD